MRILSVHVGHDSSVCLFNNGSIEKYFLTERFSRIKHDDSVSKIAGLIFKSIENEVDTHGIDVLCWSNFNQNPYNNLLGDFLQNSQYWGKKYNPNLKIISSSNHHQYHAYQTFYNSGFDEAAVVIVDGMGSNVYDNLNILLPNPEPPFTLAEVESIFKFNRTKHELLYKNVLKRVDYDCLESDEHPVRETLWDEEFDPELYSLQLPKEWEFKNSYGVGLAHDIVTLLTVGPMDGSLRITNTNADTPEIENGKTMGLASYGEENEIFKNIFLEGNTFNNNFYKECSPDIQDLLRKQVLNISKDNHKIYADLCYELYRQTERVVGDLIEKAIEKTESKNVCIGGGYAMNIVANHYYTKRFPDINFYFEPIANDSGISIGAAMSAYVDLTGEAPNQTKNTLFHGINYDVSNLKGLDKSIKEVADLLYKDKSIGVYNGMAEAGARALGNRSILFNALNPNAKDIVNRIKNREWYRPFAAAVLEEDANTYFDMGNIKSSPNMTISFPVREEYINIIPGVVHVDNTCRIQTVSQSDGYLYELLTEFKKLSGHGILLNTSFNLAGEALVENPKDAFDTLKNSPLDALYFNETHQLFFNLKVVGRERRKQRLPSNGHYHYH